MELTFRTVLTACLLNTVLIVFLYLILKKTRVIKRWGPNLILVVLGASVVRMFLPFEFGYTYSIYLEKYWTDICEVFMYEINLAGGYHLTVWLLLGIVWLAGAAVLIVEKCVAYRKASRIINLMKEIPADVLQKCVPDWEDYPEFGKLKMVVSPDCDGPFLKGILNPVVVISDRKWEKDELAYVLKHEALHHRSHDVIWKIAVDLLCTFFWWNPVFSLLKREMFQLIEIRNDLRITRKMTNAEKIGYLNCLVSVAKSVGKKEQAFAIEFTKNNVRELKQRMELITERHMGQCSRIGGLVFAGVLLCMIFLTTCVVIEPGFPVEGQFLDETNTYLVYNGEIYEVYVNIDGTWDYWFSDDDRNHFSKKVMVYEKGDNIDEK